MRGQAWQTVLDGMDRVRAHTADDLRDELDEALRERLERHRTGEREDISDRLRELDAEWDIERVLIVNAATLLTFGIAAGMSRRRLLVLPLAVAGFLLQHGLQGWCPPLALFRRLGVRTRREIDLERYALKVLRGDLDVDGEMSIDTLLDRAVQR